MTPSTDPIGAGWSFLVDVDGRGRIALSYDNREIEEAIQIILSTPLGCRVMRPEFGCRIHDLLFAPIEATTIATAKRYVAEALRRWEPRIDVREITITPDSRVISCLRIMVTYRIRATHDERTLVYSYYTIPTEEVR